MAGEIVIEMWVEQGPEFAVSLADSSKTIWIASTIVMILIQNSIGGSLISGIT